MTVTVTFIRHGESEDNPRGIWAGWKDAPLSKLGERQAQALAEDLSTTKIDMMYASPLLRAHQTGMAVKKGQKTGPRQADLPIVNDPNLREQHWGIAEGRKWAATYPEGKTKEELYSSGIFPILESRKDKFPEGESLEDVARRVERAIADCVLPHLDKPDFHVVLASHGLCISELVAALLRLDPHSDRSVSYAGLANTAWHRAVVSLPEGCSGPIDPAHPPALVVQVTEVGRRDHLSKLRIANSSRKSDPDNSVESKERQEAVEFFGGGGRAAEVAQTSSL